VVKILDCTLRDGGYINQWHFGEKRIKNIVKGLISAEIDIVEVGFLSGDAYDKEHALYPDDSYVDNVIDIEKGKTKIAAMIALENKEVDPDILRDASQSALDIVRLTFHGTKEEISKAIYVARALMDKGYEVCIQPVGTTGYTDGALLDLIGQINILKPYAFYIVDTLGEMYKHDILRMLHLIDHNLEGSVAVGFHSHNNMQLSLANAQEFVEFPTKRNIILDSSVFGMGRGAGNLYTEAITEYLNNISGAQYDILPMLQIIDEQLMPIYSETPWGSSAAYFLSAIKRCHPNYASYLLSKQSLRVSDIGVLLDSVPPEERMLYNAGLIEKMYSEYQETSVDDGGAVDALRSELAGRDVMVIAPGKSIEANWDSVAAAAKEGSALTISINFVPAGANADIDMVFVSNRKRFSVFEHIPQDKMIFTSNVVERPQGAKTVNYIDLVNSSPQVSDNAGLMLLRLLIRLGAKKVFLAGFDGFSYQHSDNYYSRNMIGANETDREMVDAKNAGMADQLSKMKREIEIEFITKSQYEDNE